MLEQHAAGAQEVIFTGAGPNRAAWPRLLAENPYRRPERSHEAMIWADPSLRALRSTGQGLRRLRGAHGGRAAGLGRPGLRASSPKVFRSMESSSLSCSLDAAIPSKSYTLHYIPTYKELYSSLPQQRQSFQSDLDSCA